VTAHPHNQNDDEASCFDVVPSRTGRVRRAFKPIVQIGWNIAALIFGGRVRGARDIALFNDHEAAVAHAIKHQKEIGAKIQEMLKYGYCPGSPFKKAVDAGLGI